MKKLYFALLVILIGVMQAAPIGSDTAKELAENWFSNLKGSKTTISMNKVSLNNFKDGESFYLFDHADGGFVLVANDDQVKPILGYSENAKIVEDIKNPAISEWFKRYDKMISELSENGFTNSIYHEEFKNILDNKFDFFNDRAKDVTPLIPVTWGQGAGWNAYCPVDSDGPDGRAYAGCVATAMAQVMTKWQSPTQGLGANSYFHGIYGSLGANFGDTIYDWESMSNTESSDAAALLIYHCGIGVEMDYSSISSRANISVMATNAMVNNFGYGKAHYQDKRNFSETEWNEQVISELDNGRPLIYRASQADGADVHAFNLDGYQGSDYFHFNWGWSGTYNGYFYLNDMTAGSHNFVDHQGGIFGIEPSAPTLGDVYEPDNSYVQAKPITLGSVQTHNFSSATDQDWVSFTIANAPTSLTLETDGDSEANTKLWIYDTDGFTKLAFNDDKSKFSKVSYDFTTNGTYYAKVKNYANNDTISDYTISLNKHYYFPSPSNLMATVGSSSIDLSWSDPIQEDRITLGYDDGIADAWVDFGANANYDLYFGVGFTNAIDYKISSADLCLKSINESDSKINISILGDNAGKPDFNNVIATSSLTLPSGASEGEWINVDFPNVPMPANSIFYIVSEWENYSNNHKIGTDSSNPDGLSFMSWYGDWYDYEGSDIMFRANITTIGGSEMVNHTLNPIGTKDALKQMIAVDQKVDITSVKSKALSENEKLSKFPAYKYFKEVVGKKDVKEGTLNKSISSYNVYRSTSHGAFYSLLANTSNLNYSDNTPQEGRPYYYVVTAVYEDPIAESVYSNEATGTIINGPMVINSPYTANIPIIDGIYNASEWNDAYSLDIVVGGTNPIMSYIKNSGTKLYICINDENLTSLEDRPQAGFYFDDDHNGFWDADSTTDEGNLWILDSNDGNGTQVAFRGIYGLESTLKTPILNPTGINAKIADNGDYVSFEIEIDLENSVCQGNPGDTIGAYFWTAYSASGLVTKGAFPAELGINWNNPAYYGDITLGMDDNTGITELIPEKTNLYASYPNPFNPATSINFGLAKDSKVKITVYNVSGQNVATLINENVKAGYHEVKFNGQNLTSGTYLLRMSIGNKAFNQKLLLIK